MSKFLVLYRSEAALSGMSVADTMANTPPEQMEAGMKMWMAWFEKAGSAIVDTGSPLGNPTTVTSAGSEAKPSSVTGYGIIEAESMAAAAELLSGHPHFYAPGASIEILEAIPMPGM